MSRIGMRPIELPDGVSVELQGQEVTVKGSKGTLAATLMDEVVITQEGNLLTIAPVNDSRRAQTVWGMQRSIVNNLVEGVSTGFSIDLEINGVGYRASVQGKVLKLQLGYSHDIDFKIPDGIEIKCETQTKVNVSGIDKQKVGQTAAEIRACRPPEPYKGKGVKYVGELIFRKEGKKK